VGLLANAKSDCVTARASPRQVPIRPRRVYTPHFIPDQEADPREKSSFVQVQIRPGAFSAPSLQAGDDDDDDDDYHDYHDNVEDQYDGYEIEEP
jgi:hypothetical protein